MGNRSGFQSVWHAARAEHAFLLRCEGLTCDEIGRRMNTTSGSASAISRQFAGKLTRDARRVIVKMNAEVGPTGSAL
jgi:transcriptional regulator